MRLLLFVAIQLAGCGVASVGMRVTNVGYVQHHDSTTAVHLDRAPAHHAIIHFRETQIACGRVTDLKVRSTHHAWTSATKTVMRFFAASEALGGAALLAKGSTDGQRLIGGTLLADAALALVAVSLFGKRRETTSRDDFGLAYGCHAGDGFIIGDRVAPLDVNGRLGAIERAALVEEIAAGGSLDIVVDNKRVTVPLEPEERCSALPPERRDSQCSDADAGAVLVTLGRVPAVVKLPLFAPKASEPAR